MCIHQNLIAFTLLFLAGIVQLAFTQPSWQWQNPLPQGDNIAQIHFVNGTRGWIVVWSKNLLHTSDGGQTWQLLPSNISLRKISFIDENRGWGIGSDHPYTYHAGIYHTTDGGHSWMHQYTDSLLGPFLDIQFTDVRNGWAIGQGFMRHTSDGGVTWHEQDAHVRPASGDYRVSFRDSLRGWAGGWRFYASKTFDGGKTWTRDSTLDGYNRFVFTDTLHGWASSTFESSRRRMAARTTDGGLTWFETPSPLRALAFPISQIECIALGDSGVYRTMNAGVSWMLVYQSPSDDGCVSCEFRDGFVHSTSVAWAHRSFGPSYFRSSDGGITWVNRTTNSLGQGFSPLHAVTFVDTLYGWTVGATFIGGQQTDEFVAKTTNGGLIWTKVATNLLSEPLAVSFVSSSTGWITGRSGVIRKTTDGGITWEQQVSGTTHTLWDVQFLDSLTGFVVGSAPPGNPGTGVFLKTGDGGINWIDKSPPGLGRIDVVSFVDTSYGWIGGDFSGTGDSPVLMRTTDGGDTWMSLLFDPTLRIERFQFSTRNRGWGYGATPGQPWFTSIMGTSDGGISWTEQLRDSSAAGLFLGRVCFLDTLRGLIVGGAGGIWFTSDGGTMWQSQTGSTSQLLADVAMVGDKRAVVVGMRSTILALDLDGVVFVGEDRIQTPAELIHVSNNYPNPFNTQTTITYRIAKAGEVSLEVYDILGQVVKKTNREHRPAGEHTHTIKMEDIASGVYYYRLIVGQAHQWGKMVLIR